MEKRGGSAVAALLVGAGLMLHSSAGHGPAPKPAPGAAATSREAASDQGPWLASCEYWASSLQEPPKAVPAPEARVAESANADGESLDRHVAVKTQTDSECNSATGTGWGLPDNLRAMPGIQMHAVIATVPDPVHSHLAPEFDRAIDALIGAASDNHYLISYSWLPWRVPKSDSPGSGHTEQHMSEEPGLLIFDQRSSSGETPNILYMFLVAEMPADGLNSEQLKKALTYELQLSPRMPQSFATDEEAKLRVIGPQYSGSAMSLVKTLDTVLTNRSVNPRSPVKRVEMAGTTETEEAYRTLNRCLLWQGVACVPDTKRTFNFSYVSFASGNAIAGMLSLPRQYEYQVTHVVLLHEDGTAYGTEAVATAGDMQTEVFSVPFPRDISLLRNSQKGGEDSNGYSDSGSPRPYLPLTTRDEGSQDTLPDFSTDITPLSQEAQVMSISHTLTQLHADFAYITATNPMDGLFLAKWLHRSNPDTRLVMEPDLLLQREGEDTAYIGSLSITPYPLVWLARSPELPGQLRSFASAEMEAYFNAASYTIGQINRSRSESPILYGYGSRPAREGCIGSEGPNCPRLWLTAVGSDGYYPVATLTTSSGLAGEPQEKNTTIIPVYPSHVWQALCVLLSLAALLHIAALCSASYASPLTCDLDIRENSMPHRRALYAQVGGGALFLMSVVVAVPVSTFLNAPTIHLDRQNLGLGIVTLLLGLLAWIIAIGKTFRPVRLRSHDAPSLFAWRESKLCVALYWGSIPATVALAAMWVRLCMRSWEGQQLGTFFSYRCLHPTSGVSPLTPALLVLWGWFFWALLHARRLRLTMDSRPLMPDAATLESDNCTSYRRTQPDMFVSDTRLQIGLLEDTTCLMIARRLLHQIFRVRAEGWKSKLLDVALMLFLAALAALWIGLCPMRALDHFGWGLGPTTLYEFFIGLLLVPLLLVALCAAARLFLMSAALRAHLLEPLERVPLRQAFTRLKGFHWVGMLRESGQLERWRDMSRSTEGIRQILNDPGMPADCLSGELAQKKVELEEEIARLQQHVKALRDAVEPPNPGKRGWMYMKTIEQMYASCSEIILCCILLPHWLRERHTLMQSVTRNAEPEKEPNVVLLAEELLAIRYVAFIRAVLAQMRYLLLFITVALVGIMLAINSYPFQPKQEIDWCVTGLFLSFSAGIVLVLAQMHRNPLLSRITNKNAKSLGLDFYLRVAGFGAVPLITWLATEYPSIGGALYGLVKPGLEVMK